MGDIHLLHAWVHSSALNSKLWSQGIPLAIAKDKIITTGSGSGGHACLGLSFAGDKQLVCSKHPIPSRVDLPAKPDYRGKIVLPNIDLEKPSFVLARVSYATNVITKHQLLDVCWPRQSDRQHLSPMEHYRPIDPILNVHPSWPPTCFVHSRLACLD
ncbi:hypothetical protein BJY00DRAFT_314705 [Aspergillus carlsbadensis]|nr:hypothetical protein BJY00DRAFT_314705 [Aspergillus carlsbadensis]